MAKAQNTFIKSKMNKDLDDRILSKGEYRDAQNINVSKSEGSDVGALENVLGNLNINSFTSGIDGAVIIGNLMDYTNDRIYVFITNYTDSSSNSLDNYAPAGAYCAIAVYDLNSGQSLELVKGSFLNFSTTHLINGINLIEELLFFTDNRNQPRKINVTLAINAVESNATAYHYTTEDQISLAKYYPYKAPQLYNNFTVKSAPSSAGTVTPAAGSVTTSAEIPVGATSIPVNAITTNVFVGMIITGTSIPTNTVINEVIVNQKNNTTTLVISAKTTGAVIVSGVSLTTTWDLTNANANIKAGMYIVLSGNNSSSNAQSQNIRISSTGTTTFTIDSTVPYDKTWASQDISIYYPTCYTKSENFTAPSLIGVVSSGNNFEPDDEPKGGQTSNTEFQIYCNGTPKVGMLLTSSVGGVFSSNQMQGFLDGTTISNVSGTSNPFTITTSRKFVADTLLKSTQILLSDPNPYYDSGWPGDKDLLKEKFVRFSYRFKYEDGEYSLMAPFTQPAFIPKQDGYLSSGTTVNGVYNKTTAESAEGFTDGAKQYDSYFFGKVKSQEDSISSSTIIEFFENRVQEVDVNIPCDYLISSLNNDLKVIEIDILYKESDGLQVKVLDTLSYTDSEILNNNTKTITYNYQSRKPFRNLSEAETVRVYDKIPVRAKTQSVTGNRVVFGNFIDKPTPPLTLDYSVGVSDKFRIDSIYSNYSSAAAYVNHSVKQNRNYQVGLVLQDKYGRSSDVVLSSLGINKQEFPAGSGEFFSGSTIFHNYRLTEENIYNWFGDSIKILFNNPIPETVTYANGYPGVYRSGFINATASNSSSANNIFTLTEWNNDIIVGSIVQGIKSNPPGPFSEAITGFDALSDPATITLSNDVVIAQNTAITIIGNANPLGWYSYKVVVKQEAEDYYNAYLPNALSGTTQYSIPLSQNQSFLTLTGDNINKIPADITDPAPEQTQFRTSDIILYPRVNARGWEPKSSQINVSAGENPTRSTFFSVDAIAKVADMGIITNPYKVSLGEAPKASGVYDAISNPTVAKISTYGTMFGGWYNNEVFNTNFNSPIPPYDPKYSVDGSFNTNAAITGARTISDAPVIIGEPVEGCIYPKIKTEWENSGAEGFQGLITIGKEIAGTWGEWSHPAASDSTELSLNYIPGRDTSNLINNTETLETACWSAPYSPFTYETALIANINPNTRTFEAELTQGTGSGTFQYSPAGGGSGSGAKIKIIATSSNVTSGYKIWSATNGSAPRYANTRILVLEGGTGYKEGDTFTIDAANVTGLAVRAGYPLSSVNIVITLKSFLLTRPNGLDVEAVTGEGSGLRLRGVNVGPWFPSGKFDKSFSQYTQEKTASINNMYWQATALGTGYRAGDKVRIPAHPEALVSPFQGTFWTDPMIITLREEDLRPVNLNNPTPVSVMEVKPKNSNLDIYWETSTVGLISQLNKTINDASSVSLPFILNFDQLGVARTDVFFQESAGPNTAIAIFDTSSQTSNLPDANFELIKVQNGNGVDLSTTIFTLTNQIFSNVNHGVIKPSPRAFSSTSANNNFTFFVKATNISLGITYTNNFTFNGTLANITPTLVDSSFGTPPSIISSTSTGGDVFFNLYAINGAYKSVAGQELSWTTSGTRESPFSLQNTLFGTIESNQGANSDRQRNKQVIKFTASGLGDGEYSETIGVTDGSGSGLSSGTITIKVTVTLPPPPPPPPAEDN